MLGAGFVTKPTLDILSEAGIKVTVGTYMQLAWLSLLLLLLLEALSPPLPITIIKPLLPARHKLDMLDMPLACVVLLLRPPP